MFNKTNARITAISGLLFPLAVLAHEEEEMGISHQMQELLPFIHINEGHWFAVIVSILLWASLVYALYSLIKKFKSL